MPARDRQAEGCVLGPAWPCSLCRLWARSWLNLGPGRMALCCGRGLPGAARLPFLRTSCRPPPVAPMSATWASSWAAPRPPQARPRLARRLAHGAFPGCRPALSAAEPATPSSHQLAGGKRPQPGYLACPQQAAGQRRSGFEPRSVHRPGLALRVCPGLLAKSWSPCCAICRLGLSCLRLRKRAGVPVLCPEALGCGQWERPVVAGVWARLVDRAGPGKGELGGWASASSTCSRPAPGRLAGTAATGARLPPGLPLLPGPPCCTAGGFGAPSRRTRG